MGSDLTGTTTAAAAGSTDVTDRAGRLLGIVASIASAVDVSDRAGRALGVIASITSAVDVSDRAARALGVVASITAPVDVSDRAARALGVVASITSAVDVSDRAARALGVVASITAAVDVSDRAARLLGRVTAPNAGDILDLTTLLDRVDRLVQRGAVYPTQVGVLQPAANTGGTLTLAAPGAGLRHYITSIVLTRAATAALAGTATLAITTTNLNGLAFRTGNAMAAGGLVTDVSIPYPVPIAAAVATTATTFVLPAPGAAVLWSLTVTYYTAT